MVVHDKSIAIKTREDVDRIKKEGGCGPDKIPLRMADSNDDRVARDTQKNEPMPQKQIDPKNQITDFTSRKKPPHAETSADAFDKDNADSTKGNPPVEQKPSFPAIEKGDLVRRPKVPRGNSSADIFDETNAKSAAGSTPEPLSTFFPYAGKARKPAPGPRGGMGRPEDRINAENVVEAAKEADGKTLLEVMGEYNSGRYAVDLLSLQQCCADLEKAKVSMPEIEAAIKAHEEKIGSPEFYVTRIMPEIARACAGKENANGRFWQINEQVLDYLAAVKEKMSPEDAVSRSCHQVPDLVKKSGGDPEALAQSFQSSLGLIESYKGAKV